jgi:putative hydrolase of the HAD superfamily
MSETLAKDAVLVFDWGGTLMEIIPQYSGPMAGWPEVRAVAGVKEALADLRGRYTLVVGTNSTDSNATQAWLALQRVALEEYFKAVFTTHELDGVQKPAVRYFRQIEAVLDRPERSFLMVGDDYRVDVLGAKSAGWRAIWYNPEHKLAPALLPLHDGEIYEMRQLNGAVARLGLPDYSTCLAWLADRETPHNILTHVNLVATIAYALAGWLAAKGAQVDPVLAHRGAMLHDLCKFESIRQKKERGVSGDHAAMARDALLERGQPALAAIADSHMISDDPESPRRPTTWEERLVFYADKLAEGSQLVPIEERLAALQKRYPLYASSMQTGWPMVSAVQDDICQHLGVEPTTLIEYLRQALGLQHAG